MRLGNELLHERVFLALGIFLLVVLYVVIMMPETWENVRHLGIVGVAVLLNLDFPV